MYDRMTEQAATDIVEKLTNDQCAAMVAAFIKTWRMTNYGYDWQAWQRIKSQRYRALARFRRLMPCTALVRLLMHDRTELIDGQIDYCVGQSANEEITNLYASIAAECGIGRHTKWLQ